MQTVLVKKTFSSPHTLIPQPQFLINLVNEGTFSQIIAKIKGFPLCLGTTQ